CRVRHRQSECGQRSWFSRSTLLLRGWIQQTQKRELAACAWFAFHPDFSSGCLYQAPGNRQSQSVSLRPGPLTGETEVLFENLLLEFGRDPRAGVRHRDAAAIGIGDQSPPPLHQRLALDGAALPEIRLHMQPYRAGARRVLHRVVQQVRNDVLYLVPIESKRGQFFVGEKVKRNRLVLKTLHPELGNLAQAGIDVGDFVLDLVAIHLQGCVAEDILDEVGQADAVVLHFREHFKLLWRQRPQFFRQQQMQVPAHDRQWRLYFVGRRSQGVPARGAVV